MRIKICFVIPSLRAGGAERIMSFIAENIDSDRFESQLLVIESEADKSYEIVNIPVTFLNQSRVRNGIPQIIGFIRKHRPEIVVSAISHLNTVMALIAFLFPKIQFVGRETIVRSVMAKIQDWRSKPGIGLDWKTKVQTTNLDAIICQSEDMRDDLQKNYGFSPSKLVVLNNPITKKFHLKKSENSESTAQFVTIGRLVPQKGHLRILSALKKLTHPFHYTIIGDGELKEAIIGYIAKNGLEEKITHIPFTKDIQSFLEKSHLYLQGSYVEGFPNALLETCAVGTPALAFDAPGGINEIIIEGVNGYIASHEDDFLHKIQVCIDHDWSPKEVNRSVTSRYSEEIILKKYETFFLHLYRSRRN